MGRLSALCGRCTSEPAVFVYCFAIGIYGAIVPNFLLQKACSPSIEPDLEFICNNTDSLLLATDITTTRSTLRELVPVLVLLLAASWRDATGQNKPLMYSAIVGEVIGVSIELLAAWKWSLSPWLTSVSDSVLYGLSGGSKLFYIGATCAITEHSSVEERTTRMAIYQAAAYTGSCLSSGLSGYCLHYLGYRWFFVFVIGLHLITLMLVCIMRQDVQQRKCGKTEIFQKMKAVFKSRPNNTIIWLMLISCVIINVSSVAESNLYLYYLQQGFNFTVVEAGIYSSFRLMFGVVSTATLSPVFTKLLKYSDFRIGVISSAMTFISTTSMIFAKTVLQLIIFAMLDFLKIFVFTLPMSIITKCVKSDEVGVFVSLRFIGGCLLPIFVFYIYDYIFSVTSHTMPGAFFFASSTIALLVLVCFWISPCIYKTPENGEMNTSTTAADAERSENISSENSKFLEETIPSDNRSH